MWMRIALCGNLCFVEVTDFMLLGFIVHVGVKIYIKNLSKII